MSLPIGHCSIAGYKPGDFVELTEHHTFTLQGMKKAHGKWEDLEHNTTGSFDLKKHKAHRFFRITTTPYISPLDCTVGEINKAVDR